MTKEDLILKARNTLMSTPKVLCTGNPNNINYIANGIKQVFPNSTFIHKSNGFDFTNINESIEKKLQQLFSTHNTFINASYINDNCQQKLLKICNKYMPIGNVFNIGSTHEYDNLGPKNYTKSKQTLRDLSLQLNTFRFQTCHIILGGIKKDNKETENWVSPLEVAELINWIIKQRYKIPIIGINQPKQPW